MSSYQKGRITKFDLLESPMAVCEICKCTKYQHQHCILISILWIWNIVINFALTTDTDINNFKEYYFIYLIYRYHFSLSFSRSIIWNTVSLIWSRYVIVFETHVPTIILISMRIIWNTLSLIQSNSIWNTCIIILISRSIIWNTLSL